MHGVRLSEISIWVKGASATWNSMVPIVLLVWTNNSSKDVNPLRQSIVQQSARAMKYQSSSPKVCLSLYQLRVWRIFHHIWYIIFQNSIIRPQMKCNKVQHNGHIRSSTTQNITYSRHEELTRSNSFNSFPVSVNCASCVCRLLIQDIRLRFWLAGGLTVAAWSAAALWRGLLKIGRRERYLD